MKIIPLYKNQVITLPKELVCDKLSTATNDELKVLLAVFAEQEFTVAEIAARLDMTEKSFLRSLSFWENEGVLVCDGNHKPKKEKNVGSVEKEKSELKSRETRKIKLHTSLPHYASDELAEVMERVKGASELIDSCQQTLGKIFNTQEASTMIALSEHFSLSNEYLLLLCSYAVSVEKKSVHFIEKLATDFYDREIVSYPALEEELNRMREKSSMESFVRTLFGIGKRTLIKKEKECIQAWSEKFRFDRTMIEKAFEITVSKTNEPRISYANAILENWFAAGYQTPDDVDNAEKEREKQPKGSSFETDNFYEAALQRSYNKQDT